jgi:hypothetical protein
VSIGHQKAPKNIQIGEKVARGKIIDILNKKKDLAGYSGGY